MTAIGIFMFLTGMVAIGIIGDWPGPRIGIPLLLWTFGGSGLFLAGMLAVVCRVMP